MTGQCEAFTQKGERCTRAAKHQHETPGDALKVCQRHYDMLTHRARLGSDEEKVRAWRSRL